MKMPAAAVSRDHQTFLLSCAFWCGLVLPAAGALLAEDVLLVTGAFFAAGFFVVVACGAGCW